MKKLQTSPFPSRKPRRKRKGKPSRGRPAYTILDCGGCPGGCPKGVPCKPIRGTVHGGCLKNYRLHPFGLVGVIVKAPVGDCLFCKKPLAEERET